MGKEMNTASIQKLKVVFVAKFRTT